MNERSLKVLSMDCCVVVVKKFLCKYSESTESCCLYRHGQVSSLLPLVSWNWSAGLIITPAAADIMSHYQILLMSDVWSFFSCLVLFIWSHKNGLSWMAAELCSRFSGNSILRLPAWLLLQRLCPHIHPQCQMAASISRIFWLNFCSVGGSC